MGNWDLYNREDDLVELGSRANPKISKNVDDFEGEKGWFDFRRDARERDGELQHKIRKLQKWRN